MVADELQRAEFKEKTTKERARQQQNLSHSQQQRLQMHKETV